MPRRMTEKERQEFLAEPHIGVLSVAVGYDRPPRTTPVWYGYEPGGEIWLVTGRDSRKGRLLAKGVRSTGGATHRNPPWKGALAAPFVPQKSTPSWLLSR